MEEIVKVSNLTKDVFSGNKKIRIIENISLTINKGDFVLITGRSGSGKSTLLYQLGLLDNPTEGEIIIKNCNAVELSEIEKTNFRLRNFGYVFQDYALLPELKAIENVILPLFMVGFSKEQALSKGRDVLKKVGLEGKENNLPSGLSGGEQQRVSIARAIVNDPEIIFADEPTANLDAKTSFKIIDLFKELNKKGQTIVMVSHERDIRKEEVKFFELVDGKLVS